jgi:cephalosporin-C deacetylase-like acetyl esterase
VFLLSRSSQAAEPLSPTPLPNTQPLSWDGDLAERMIEGVDRFLLREIGDSVKHRAKHWQRDFSSVEAYERSIEPQRNRLNNILGMRDARVEGAHIEFISSIDRPSLVARGSNYEVHEVRWQTHRNVDGEGLLLVPRDPPRAIVVAIPDADQTPEQLSGLSNGVDASSQFARRLAENQCIVLVPSLVSRGRNEFSWYGRQHGISHREFLYRSAYELGRHIIGYELAKVLVGIDGLSAAYDHRLPVGVFGYGEGGMLALYAAALDSRIDVTVVSGYWNDRNSLWQQPIERNVFGLLEQFGDAELATMVAPRKLIIEACDHPKYELPPGTGGAPARLETPAIEVVEREVARARTLISAWGDAQEWLTVSGMGAGRMGSQATLQTFLASLLPATDLAVPAADDSPQPLRPSSNVQDRLLRQMVQLDSHTQDVLRDSPKVRSDYMSQLDTSSIENYQKSVEKYRDTFRHDVIGHFEHELLAANPRTRKIQETERVTYYEVVLDVFPDVFAYGILCLPRDVKPGERRPVVVCQHGLEGRPQSVIGEQDAHYYAAFATELAEQGFVTFAPQNIYIFQDRFRTLQRKAYLLKKTLFSIMVPQHQQIVDWLQSLPMVDPERVGFYGLSYGGKSAMRIPSLVPDYCLSICSADFNEWVDKNASTRNPRSYVWTGEYEIFEWDLGSTFNYAEMAALIAPRPFMVERGHFDGVADDWTVAWEYAKVRHLYAAQLKIPDRTAIEWFDGPHKINGVGTFEFLRKHLDWKPHARDR